MRASLATLSPSRISFRHDEEMKKNLPVKWPTAQAARLSNLSDISGGKSGERTSMSVDERRSPSVDTDTAKPPKDEFFVNQTAVVDEEKVCYPPETEQIAVVDKKGKVLHPPPYVAPTAESPGKGEKAKTDVKSMTIDYDKSKVPIPDKGREKSSSIDDRGENTPGAMDRALGPDSYKEKVIENPAKRHPFHEKEKDLQRAGVSDRFDIETYAKREWKGNTSKAKAVLSVKP